MIMVLAPDKRAQAAAHAAEQKKQDDEHPADEPASAES
jgi:hypothetical protein